MLAPLNLKARSFLLRHSHAVAANGGWACTLKLTYLHLLHVCKRAALPFSRLFPWTHHKLNVMSLSKRESDRDSDSGSFG